jgi:hypothetical protein
MLQEEVGAARPEAGSAGLAVRDHDRSRLTHGLVNLGHVRTAERDERASSRAGLLRVSPSVTLRLTGNVKYPGTRAPVPGYRIERLR